MDKILLSLTLLLVVPCYLVCVANAKKLNITSDQSSLLALKACISDQPHNPLTSNWSTSTSVCNWIGVKCGSKHRRVMALNLSYMGLAGTIPPHVGNLSFLVWLSAANNSFHGSVPNELTRLYRLKGLYLRFNSFNGEIPSSLGLLHRLQLLSLRGNSFTGNIPTSLCNLSSLQKMDLGSNMLTGFIPSSIFNLSSLQRISVQDNKLSGPMPSIFFDMPSLQIFALSMNKLSGRLPRDMFHHLPNLQGFEVSSNQLYGEVPSTLFKCKQLYFLGLEDNNFKGRLPPEIGNLTMLSYLYLGENNFEDMKVIRILDLSINQLVGDIPTTIGGLKDLVSLSLANNRLEGSIPESFGTMRKAKSSSEVELPPLATWRRVSYQELLRATERFSVNNLIGEGSFGSVYKGTLSDGMNVAIKVLNLQVEGAFPRFDAECEVLRNIRHRNLVKFITACSNMDFKAFVLEYMPNGNLEMWLYSDSRFLNLLQRLNIMIDVAAALEYLHFGNATRIVHCDLKPSNVLLDEDMVAHVADFGIAKLIGDGDSITQTMTLATIGYMAPEYGLEGIVSTRGDVYSYGILLMETFTRKRPTDNLPEQRINMADVLVRLHKVKLKFLRDFEGGNVRVSTN
ncbi:hypothetical protein CJ030_MR5G023979 [Morella rubra]|uniref:non-specific serine/threonine protein kinase n=1 Tax=Morella rubra TaxID=262757 RepID=A0A6A1VKI8_9ROSI|nr:hypothetical protein CJ030_MR5G023979 [Morella rubra]